MQHLEYIKKYLEARGFKQNKTEWKNTVAFINEVEQQREIPIEELAERVLRLIKAEQSFKNHINTERAKLQ